MDLPISAGRGPCLWTCLYPRGGGPAFGPAYIIRVALRGPCLYPRLCLGTHCIAVEYAGNCLSKYIFLFNLPLFYILLPVFCIGKLLCPIFLTYRTFFVYNNYFFCMKYPKARAADPDSGVGKRSYPDPYSKKGLIRI